MKTIIVLCFVQQNFVLKTQEGSLFISQFMKKKTYVHIQLVNEQPRDIFLIKWLKSCDQSPASTRNTSHDASLPSIDHQPLHATGPKVLPSINAVAQVLYRHHLADLIMVSEPDTKRTNIIINKSQSYTSREAPPGPGLDFPLT